MTKFAPRGYGAINFLPLAERPVAPFFSDQSTPRGPGYWKTSCVLIKSTIEHTQFWLTENRLREKYFKSIYSSYVKNPV